MNSFWIDIKLELRFTGFFQDGDFLISITPEVVDEATVDSTTAQYYIKATLDDSTVAYIGPMVISYFMNQLTVLIIFLPIP